MPYIDYKTLKLINQECRTLSVAQRQVVRGLQANRMALLVVPEDKTATPYLMSAFGGSKRKVNRSTFESLLSRGFLQKRGGLSNTLKVYNLKGFFYHV